MKMSTASPLDDPVELSPACGTGRTRRNRLVCSGRLQMNVRHDPGLGTGRFTSDGVFC